MARLFVSDLDGTLFNFLHETDFLIRKGISKIIKHGDYFVVATGRNMRRDHIEFDFKNLPIYCVAMNGAIIINPQREIIYERIIDKNIIREILDKFPTINFEFIGRTNCYMKCLEADNQQENRNMPFLIRMVYHRFQRLCASEYIYNCTNEDILAHDILKFNCYIKNKDTVKRFEEYLELNKDKLVNAPYGGTIYEITAAGVNKGNTIKHLAEMLKVKDQDIYAYGDGENDIAMLQMFQNSYAPKNASEEAKHAAKHIIGDNRFYGVIHHMLKISKNR